LKVESGEWYDSGPLSISSILVRLVVHIYPDAQFTDSTIVYLFAFPLALGLQSDKPNKVSYRVVKSKYLMAEEKSK
jgi:hypothetical protein